MTQEKLNHVVSGVLLDFMDWLEKSKTVLLGNNPLSSILLVDDFLKEKGVKGSAPLEKWADRCDKVLLEASEADSLALLPPKKKDFSEKCDWYPAFCDVCEEVECFFSSTNPCPHGYVFGQDFESHDDCEHCEMGDAYFGRYETEPSPLSEEVYSKFLSYCLKEWDNNELRDKFAMAALSAVIKGHSYARAHPEEMASYAYAMADAMMKEREKKNGSKSCSGKDNKGTGSFLV